MMCASSRENITRLLRGAKGYRCIATNIEDLACESCVLMLGGMEPSRKCLEANGCFGGAVAVGGVR